MEFTKVRRKSSCLMGTTKCMVVRRIDRIHSRGSISGHVNDRCGKLIRCMRKNIKNRRRRLKDQGRGGGGGGGGGGGAGCSDIEVGDFSGKR